jgi:hypothetical protein
MKWIITQDHVGEGSACCLGMTGNADMTKTLRALTREERPAAIGEYVRSRDLLYEFQLLDDDGNLCLTGRCGDITDCSSDLAFAPMDEMQGYTGCTELRYRKFVATNEWEAL